MAEQPISWDHCLQHAAISDIGMRRSNNQDSHAAVLAEDAQTWQQRGHLFMVADGMGAHAAGELASKLAVDGIPHLYLKYRDDSPPEALHRAILETNVEIYRRGQANLDFHNMGTTGSVLLLLPQGAIVGHVGDSRVYRLREQRLEQLSYDHSLVWEMRDAKQLPTQIDVSGVLPKNVITRSLGPHPSVKIDLEGPFPIQAGDTFLVCSDGLTGEVEDEELGPILAHLPPTEAARVLVDLANLRGGPDNITVIVSKVTGPEMVTGTTKVGPLLVGHRQTKAKTVHPALWVLTGVCFLASLGMMVFGRFFPALLAALGGLITLTVGILQKFGDLGPSAVALVGNRRLGRGPYTNTTSLANAELADKLAELVHQLNEAAEEADRPIDRDSFDDRRQQASTAADAGQYSQAVREYCRAINLMMVQLRGQHGSASSSEVDL